MLSPPEEGHNYMIMEIPNFIAMFSTRGGDISQVMAKMLELENVMVSS